MHHSEAAVDNAVLRKKEQKDMELDKKIIALRKKNEALMRRYQEIEEDKKRAEQEGMAVTSRRARPDGLTITITKPHHERRVVTEKWGNSCSSASSFGVASEEDEEESDHVFTFRMGRRVQLAVTMDNKVKGKRVVSEKWGSESVVNPLGEVPDISSEEMGEQLGFRREKRMQIAITMEKKGQADGRRIAERKSSGGEDNSQNALLREEREESPQNSPGDKNSTLTGKEWSEYKQWKKERDQIDLERLTRHKNARGKWRRAWDVEKPEGMFEDMKDGKPVLDCPQNKKGGRNARRSQLWPPPSEGKGRGQQHRKSSSESVSRKLPVVSSKARGKDRLTGRARRWDAKESDDMSFPKDEPDNHKLNRVKMHQQKNQTLVSETGNSLTGLEKYVRLQEPSVSIPQATKGGMDPSAGEAQGINEKTGRCLIQDGSSDETEANPKLSKTVTEADLTLHTNCKNMDSGQEVSGSIMQASRTAIKEIYEDCLGKKTCSERYPDESCAEKFNQVPVVAETGSGGEGLSAMRQTAGTQFASFKNQAALQKKRGASASHVQREELHTTGEIQEIVNQSVQDERQLGHTKQGPPDSCSKETQN